MKEIELMENERLEKLRREEEKLEAIRKREEARLRKQEEVTLFLFIHFFLILKIKENKIPEF